MAKMECVSMFIESLALRARRQPKITPSSLSSSSKKCLIVFGRYDIIFYLASDHFTTDSEEVIHPSFHEGSRVRSNPSNVSTLDVPHPNSRWYCSCWYSYQMSGWVAPSDQLDWHVCPNPQYASVPHLSIRLRNIYARVSTSNASPTLPVPFSMTSVCAIFAKLPAPPT